MPKQRLIDFRGGVNEKISGHMIGDSQGQSATDVDLTEVKLRGRKKFDSTTKAQGDFYYEAGSRYESTFSSDSTYRTNAVDFVEWNRDLYIARFDPNYTGANTNNGVLQRILDGGSSVAALQHDPPASASVNPDYPFKSNESNWLTINGGSGQQIVAAYAGQPYIAGSSPTYGNIDAANFFILSGLTSNLFTGIWGYNTNNNTMTPLMINNISPFSISPIYRLYGTNQITSLPTSGTVNTNIETNGLSFYTSNLNNNFIPYDANAGSAKPAAGYGMYATSPASFSLSNTSTNLTSFITNSQLKITILSSPNTLYSPSGYPSANVNYYWYITFPQNVQFTGNAGSGSAFSILLVLWDSYYGQTSAGTSGQAYIPSTPAFTYDDARAFVYRQFTDDADKLAGWDLDPAEGAYNSPWLENNRSLASTSDAGYYLSIINNSSSTPVLPQESQDKTLASLVSGGKFITETDALRSPLRLNFTIGAPADGGSVTCYRLYRVDSFNSINSPLYLGYIKPDPNLSVTVNSSGNIQISGLSNSSGVSLKSYRVSWKAYQGTTLNTTLSGSYLDSYGFINQSGKALSVSSGVSYIYVNNDSDSVSGADIWIEEKVIDNTSYDSTGNSDVWAVIGAIDYFKSSTVNLTTTFATLSDYLDVFSSSVASGVGSTGTLTTPPDNLKFLEESNNFFFAVGTSKTDIATSPVGRWGTGDNKADTWLFISTYNNPRDWPLDAYLEFDSGITGLKGYAGETIVWTESGTFRVFGSQANQMRKVKLPTTEGMKEGTHRTAVQVNQYLVWVSASGICVYNGSTVQNISKGRFDSLDIISTGSQADLHAGQIDGRYYVTNADHRGYVVDFNLEGFPITAINFVEYDNLPLSSRNTLLAGTDYQNPVLVYRPAVNKLYSRLGIVEGSTQENTWDYETRNFDGGQFGRNKLIHSVTINGPSGSAGTIRVRLDNGSSYVLSQAVTIADSPVTIYLPALSVADVWSVVFYNWAGEIDYIDTEYEIL